MRTRTRTNAFHSTASATEKNQKLKEKSEETKGSVEDSKKYE